MKHFAIYLTIAYTLFASYNIQSMENLSVEQYFLTQYDLHFAPMPLEFDFTEEQSAIDTPQIKQPNNAKSFPCPQPQCQKIFKFQSHLTRHIATHKNIKAFPCPRKGCDKNFSQQSYLKIHLQSHDNAQPFKCTHGKCKKKFNRQNELNKHLLTHINQKQFACPHKDCIKKYAWEKNLKTHLQTHEPKNIQ
jgi:uncharacterized Zn-finger protein